MAKAYEENLAALRNSIRTALANAGGVGGLELVEVNGLPATGLPDKLYVDLTDGATYRWSGTIFSPFTAAVDLSNKLDVAGTAANAAKLGDVPASDFITVNDTLDFGVIS